MANKSIEFSDSIDDYNKILCRGVCGMEKIIWWLIKYEEAYDTVLHIQRKRISSEGFMLDLKTDEKFEKLYGKMNYLDNLYKNETYFKEQLEIYDKVKDSVAELKKWFKYQKTNTIQQELFSRVFFDNRHITNFNLKVKELELNRNDFKYTLRFMAIIEKSKMIEISGTVKMINPLEVFKEKRIKTKTGFTFRRAFKKRELILSADDEHGSEHLIIFKDGKTKHLENISVGEYVEIYASLRGGKWINTAGIKDYYHSLIGWSIKKLIKEKKATQANRKQEGLYYKYFL